MLVRLKGQLYRVTPPTVTALNPIGSGDCLLAGLVDGWLNGLPPEETIRHAFGCAVANALVWDAGGINPAEARTQAVAVTVEPISG
ncbi:MAG: PfkB family carbohydrate kinase [Isosphaeraceae bacterium]